MWDAERPGGTHDSSPVIYHRDRRFIAGIVQLPCVPEGRLNPGRVGLVPKIAFFKANAVPL